MGLHIVLATKKDGKVRFCVDYRRLNDVTVKDAYPLPRVDDCLDSLAGSKWFSSMDLNSGFWQIGMSPDDKEKTAFITSLGLYQFTVMPFGLANSPSTFERLMENILRGLQWQECLVYMDDVITPSRTFEDGIIRLEHILERLTHANLKLKPSKCTLFQKEIKFLGHVVSESGITTDPEKISDVRDWPIPTTAKQVRSFLGLCSYYRRFVQSFAKIARPLHRLCEKQTKFEWTEECTQSFETLKSQLTTAPILAYPLPDLGFILDTDASDKSVGAVLSQSQEGSERVIAYMSKTMNKHEQQYCVTRKELLAVVIALKTFHSYLYGQKILLRTDNAAISWMKNLKKPTGQTARWLQEIETYHLEIVHRAGRTHSNADALSRRPCKSCERQELGNMDSEDEDDSVQNGTTEVQHGSICAITRSSLTNENAIQNTISISGWEQSDIRQAQMEDDDISLVFVHKECDDPRPQWDMVSQASSALKTIWRSWDRLKIEGGLLYRQFIDEEKNTDLLQLLVPKSLRSDVLHNFHDIPSAGHLGAEKTLSRIQQFFYWPQMKKDVEMYCKNCDHCAARKPPKSIRAPLKTFSVGEPMERVAVDILGPLPLTDMKNKYILVVSDCFTKWTEAFPIPDQESITVTKVIVNEFICRFGAPLQLHSDQGGTFEAQLFQHMCCLFRIQKTRTTSQRPQANGTVERFNRTLLSMLTMYSQKNQKSWDSTLPQVMMAYRSSVHSSTGVTPNKMMFGRNILMPMAAIIPRPPREDEVTNGEDYVEKLQGILSDVHETARRHIKQNTEYQKKHYDVKTKHREFDVGQPVWLYDASKRVGVCSKLTCKWKGPYVIMKRLDDVTYLVKRSPKQKGKVYHIDRLLPYRGRNPPRWFRTQKPTVTDGGATG